MRVQGYDGVSVMSGYINYYGVQVRNCRVYLKVVYIYCCVYVFNLYCVCFKNFICVKYNGYNLVSVIGF